MSIPYQKLDPLIHQPARLSIMAGLAASRSVEFAALRDAINISDSLLSRYVAQLEDAGYVCVRKKFINKRPKTWLCLTKKGKLAFEEHLKILNGIVNRE